MQNAAVFLLNSEYLKGFEVFSYSLNVTNSFRNIPILVYTTDSNVVSDTFVRNISDEIIFLDEKHLSEFSQINKTAAPKWRFPEGVDPYYFHKLAIFSEARFDNLVYFDSDLICVNNIDSIFSYANGADIAGCKTFGGGAFKNDKGERLPDGDIEKNVSRAIASSHLAGRPKEKSGMNSGVMVINNKILGPQLKDRLFEMAEEEGFVGDQNILCSYVHRNEDVSFKYLPQAFNLPRRMFDNTGVEFFNAIKNNLKILHYNARHPWHRGREKTYMDYIWWDLYGRSRPFVQDVRNRKMI